MATNNGTLTQYQSLEITFKCQMNLRIFPYDTQLCQLTFGSWHHHTGVVNLSESSYADFSYYDPAPDFKLMELTAKRYSMTYPGYLEQYANVTYTFHLKRVSGEYSIKLVLVGIINGLLVLATFPLPPASHEKITLCGLLFVGLLLQLIYIHDVVPASGETLLANFLIFALFIDMFATVLAVVSYHVHMRSSLQKQARSSIIQNEEDDYNLKIQMPIDVSETFYGRIITTDMIIQEPTTHNLREWDHI